MRLYLRDGKRGGAFDLHGHHLRMRADGVGNLFHADRMRSLVVISGHQGRPLRKVIRGHYLLHADRIDRVPARYIEML